ncbi:MAG: hypothetical protein SFY66_24280 [Oculatellaceae cyanobacterium bins.114]|nr:hypothetical protein [Oculatellaceae cyanobacterium bins.114]
MRVARVSGFAGLKGEFLSAWYKGGLGDRPLNAKERVLIDSLFCS